MEGLIIHITWPYFLGIVGSIVGLAWYDGSRFSAMQKDIDWLVAAVKELQEKSGNQS